MVLWVVLGEDLSLPGDGSRTVAVECYGSFTVGGDESREGSISIAFHHFPCRL